MSKVSLLALAMSAGAAAPVLAQVATSDETQSHLAQIASDAATRTSLSGSEAPGLLAYRQDGMGVDVGGQFQFRYTANIRDEGDNEEGFTSGFSIPRARIDVEAQLNDTWSVYMKGEFMGDTFDTEDGVLGGGEFSLEDAWVDWETSETWTVRAGQFKIPTLRENLISSKFQQAADRSVVNEVYNLGRGQGIAAMYDADTWRFIGAFTDGAGTANSPFNGAGDADYAFSARGEWLFAGQWEQLEDFAGWQGQENAGMVGGAIHYQDGGDTGVGNNGATAEVSFLQLTADAQWEGNGWNAFGAAIWNNIDPDGGDTMSNFGFVLQGGVFADESNEFFGRFGMVLPDSDAAGDDDFSTVTVGWNHYFIPNSHASKFTLDLQWFLSTTDDTFLVDGGIPGIGLLDAANDTQIAVRAQYSSYF